MASFQAKIGCQRPQKREKKNYCSVPFRSNPTSNRNSQKNRKKIKKYHYGFISSHNSLEKDEKERR